MNRDEAKTLEDHQRKAKDCKITLSLRRLEAKATVPKAKGTLIYAIVPNTIMVVTTQLSRPTSLIFLLLD
jgi:hypothetical protein